MFHCSVILIYLFSDLLHLLREIIRKLYNVHAVVYVIGGGGDALHFTLYPQCNIKPTIFYDKKS